ncbi:unnamed protein product, partial [Arctia plantaginis]
MFASRYVCLFIEEGGAGRSDAGQVARADDEGRSDAGPVARGGQTLGRQAAMALAQRLAQVGAALRRRR